jgi:hypothetical protein
MQDPGRAQRRERQLEPGRALYAYNRELVFYTPSADSSLYSQLRSKEKSTGHVTMEFKKYVIQVLFLKLFLKGVVPRADLEFDVRRWGIRRSRTQGKSYPGELVPKKLGTISPGEVVPGYDFSTRNRTQQY